MIWPETWELLLLCTLGIMLIIVRNGVVAVIFVMCIFLLGGIAQNKSDERHRIEFIKERFNAGDTLECGMFRYKQTLVDPANGWKRYGEDRLIKDNEILQLDWCSVSGKIAPEPQAVDSWLFYALLSVVFGILRFAFHNQRKAFYVMWDRLEEENKNTASEKTELEPKMDKQGEQL